MQLALLQDEAVEAAQGSAAREASLSGIQFTCPVRYARAAAQGPSAEDRAAQEEVRLRGGGSAFHLHVC
jgi:hypothetical protein